MTAEPYLDLHNITSTTQTLIPVKLSPLMPVTVSLSVTPNGLLCASVDIEGGKSYSLTAELVAVNAIFGPQQETLCLMFHVDDEEPLDG